MPQKIDVLSQYLGSYKTLAGHNHYFECPGCHHRNNKMTINLEKGVFNCWHCGLKGKSFIWLLKLAGASNPNQYKKIFQETQQINLEDIDKIFGKEEVRKSKLALPKGYESLFRNIDKAFYKPALEYLLNRGLKKEDVLKYDIHYSVSEQRILFPSYDRDHNLNYYVARTIQRFENYKYKFNATNIWTFNV